ncbi:sigma-70 family RNA polymerase sigma factor [Levilactobacillus tujiorum]|uniref:Sigma-70 family RNA polymerase sigma factor n=1 Tax=Levilactobacillus tujiorum TaxID=2912243 RepID=A0ABX1L7F2_9LACO|nr:sigma-70 family RNA polymerase sigma factor [Levilactobacillus tujiorum]MCH5464862.1 competence protein ComX [Levilactobacillus tujiorum]NLR11923.1 sigma-70 family RNA polymerase sigma factor [Lactobacillus sp. HBUAS51387]NLR29897.1 sigma-70 family RNA polymerase sigma factor [Levilactobacillus tujiorum]
MTELTDQQLLALIRQSLDSPALLVLFDRYRPVLYKLQHRYFIPGYDRDDWEQEALLVFCRVAQRFEVARQKSFGAFYRQALRFRVYDLIRRVQTKKRVDDRQAISLEANRTFISETIRDGRWCLGQRLEVQEAVIQLAPLLSPVEHAVFGALLRGRTLVTISQDQQLSFAQATRAANRSRQKLRQLMAE